MLSSSTAANIFIPRSRPRNNITFLCALNWIEIGSFCSVLRLRRLVQFHHRSELGAEYDMTLNAYEARHYISISIC